MRVKPGALVLLLTACLVPAAAAQDAGYPNHTVRFIVSSGPGGNPDVLARMLADRMGKDFGVAFVVVNGIWVGLLFGTLCARFRDMPQMIGSIMQIIYYLSPIMWMPKQLYDRLPWLVDYNPVSCILALIRDPLLGQMPRLWDFEVVVAMTIAGYLVAIPFFARFRARIAYWL